MDDVIAAVHLLHTKKKTVMACRGTEREDLELLLQGKDAKYSNSSEAGDGKIYYVSRDGEVRYFVVVTAAAIQAINPSMDEAALILGSTDGLLALAGLHEHQKHDFNSLLQRQHRGETKGRRANNIGLRPMRDDPTQQTLQYEDVKQKTFQIVVPVTMAVVTRLQPLCAHGEWLMNSRASRAASGGRRTSASTLGSSAQARAQSAGGSRRRGSGYEAAPGRGRGSGGSGYTSDAAMFVGSATHAGRRGSGYTSDTGDVGGAARHAGSRGSGYSSDAAMSVGGAARHAGSHPGYTSDAAMFVGGAARHAGAGHSGGGAMAAVSAAHSSTYRDLAQRAQDLLDIYRPGFGFPQWSVEMLRKGELASCMTSAVVYHDAREDAMEVVSLATEREPVNIEMQRLYDMQKLQSTFGWQEGAYARSSSSRLMPHIAIYCHTPMVDEATGSKVFAHVINAIGIAFDSKQQKDYEYFMAPDGRGLTPRKWAELVHRMSCTWAYIFKCAQDHQLTRIYNCAVGGGFFASELNQHPSYSYDQLKEESLGPVKARYPSIEVRELREIFGSQMFEPSWGPVLKHSLLVNAWDPWSMVGNGNKGDNSLDGKMGRVSAMAVLCWPPTNPLLRYQAVEQVA